MKTKINYKKSDLGKIDILDLQMDEDRLNNLDINEIICIVDKIENLIDIEYLSYSIERMKNVVKNILIINKLIVEKVEEFRSNDYFVESYTILRKKILKISTEKNLGEIERKVLELLIKNHMTKHLIILNPKLGPRNSNN